MNSILKNSIVIALLAIGFLGCSSDLEPVPGIEVGTTTLNVNGVSRTLDYRVPEAGADAVIISLHGATDTATRFEEYSKLTEIVNSTQGFGIIYPTGINKKWNDGRTSAATDTDNADDVGFINAIIANYKEKGYSKFYLVGMSNGGVMAQRMACESADDIDGIAFVASTQTTQISLGCTDSTTLKTMMVYGDADNVFKSDGTIAFDGGTHIGIDATRDYWLNRNGCSSITQTASLNTVDDDNTIVNVNDGQSCTAAVRYFDVQGGGHRWPDPSADNGAITIAIVGYGSHEFSTAKEIVKFFGL